MTHTETGMPIVTESVIVKVIDRLMKEDVDMYCKNGLDKIAAKSPAFAMHFAEVTNAVLSSSGSKDAVITLSAMLTVYDMLEESELMYREEVLNGRR